MAMFFPMIPEAIPAQAAAEIGRVPAFDMEARRFLLVDGKLVERTGQEAVRQWFELALRQQPGPGAHLPHQRGEAVRHRPGGCWRQSCPPATRRRSWSAACGRPPASAQRCGPVRDLAISRQGRACLVEFTAVLHTGETVEVSVDV